MKLTTCVFVFFRSTRSSKYGSCLQDSSKVGWTSSQDRDCKSLFQSWSVCRTQEEDSRSEDTQYPTLGKVVSLQNGTWKTRISFLDHECFGYQRSCSSMGIEWSSFSEWKWLGKWGIEGTQRSQLRISKVSVFISHVHRWRCQESFSKISIGCFFSQEYFHF